MRSRPPQFTLHNSCMWLKFDGEVELLNTSAPPMHFDSYDEAAEYQRQHLEWPHRDDLRIHVGVEQCPTPAQMKNIPAIVRPLWQDEAWLADHRLSQDKWGDVESRTYNEELTRIGTWRQLSFSEDAYAAMAGDPEIAFQSTVSGITLRVDYSSEIGPEFFWWEEGQEAEALKRWGDDLFAHGTPGVLAGPSVREEWDWMLTQCIHNMLYDQISNETVRGLECPGCQSHQTALICPGPERLCCSCGREWKPQP